MKKHINFAKKLYLERKNIMKKYGTIFLNEIKKIIAEEYL